MGQKIKPNSYKHRFIRKLKVYRDEKTCFQDYFLQGKFEIAELARIEFKFLDSEIENHSDRSIILAKSSKMAELRQNNFHLAPNEYPNSYAGRSPIAFYQSLTGFISLIGPFLHSSPLASLLNWLENCLF